MSLSAVDNNAMVGNVPVVPHSVTRPLTEIKSQTVIELQDYPGISSSSKENNHFDKNDIEEAVKALNEFTELAAQDILFSMDEESGKAIVKVIDTKTQEVLRQFPSVEALSIARSIDKMQGFLIREKA